MQQLAREALKRVALETAQRWGRVRGRIEEGRAAVDRGADDRDPILSAQRLSVALADSHAAKSEREPGGGAGNDIRNPSPGAIPQQLDEPSKQGVP